MRIILLISAILLFSAYAQDAADLAASRFLALGAAQQRQSLNSLWTTNPVQVFQLAYGLKRQQLYSLIQDYFPPSIVEIVLYGSYSFYLQTGRLCSEVGGELVTGSNPRDSLSDFYLSAHRYIDSDKRDSTSSTYINWHTTGFGAKRWTLTPVASTFAGTAFFITLTVDDVMYDGINQTGWVLTALRETAFDKPSPYYSHAFVMAPPTTTNVWILTPVDRGDGFVISLAFDEDMLDGISQTGWVLDFNPVNPAIDQRPYDLSSFDNSYYATYNDPNMQTTFRQIRIVFGG